MTVALKIGHVTYDDGSCKTYTDVCLIYNPGYITLINVWIAYLFMTE